FISLFSLLLVSLILEFENPNLFLAIEQAKQRKAFFFRFPFVVRLNVTQV
ncbi:unnamed protein product, partial [Arabidopsis halleri]